MKLKADESYLLIELFGKNLLGDLPKVILLAGNNKGRHS